MQDHKFLQELENHRFEPWDASSDDIKEKAQDEEIIDDALEVRGKEEPDWKWAASRWNLLTEPVDDPRISNVLLPFIRMIGSTAISSLSQAHRTNRYKPRQRSDDAKAILWQSASDHVDNACGMRNELDDFYTNYVVLGTAGLEDYVALPHINKRYKTSQGWEHKAIRDFSRPKIGTRSRSPWTFGFWTGTSDPNEFTPVFYRDFYSYNQFIQEFANVYLPDGTPKYENCQCVAPGERCFITKDGTVEYEDMDHNGVSVITFQDPVRDIYRKYANGVRILNMPLHEYNRIQKTTLSIARKNHKYDANLRVQSPYGMGDTHLLKGLDALYQAIGNLNIDNYKLANTNLISIKNRGSSALDGDLDYLPGFVVDGEVISTPMGTVRLGDYQAFKTMIDEWAIWTTGQNFQQLVGDTSKTAFELQQRIKASSRANEYTMAKLAAGCFRKHAQNRLSFILSDMTVEEYKELDVAEIPSIRELIKKNKASKDDYTWEAGAPTQRIMREKVKIKNRDIVENFGDKGQRTIDGLQDKGEASFDSEVTVAGEYFWPVEYVESGAVPDIEVEVDLGTEEELRFQKLQFLGNFARQRLAEAANFPNVEGLKTRFDAQKIDEELTRSTGLPIDSVMASETQDEEEVKLDEAIKQAEQLLSPSQNAQVPQSPVTAQTVDTTGFGAFGGQQTPAANPVSQAEAGAMGAA